VAYLVFKVLLSAAVIVAVAEIAKRSTLLGALLASLPLTSLLAFVWLWLDTRDPEQVARLSTSILWLVLPSLVLFIALPILLRRGVPFAASLALSATLTVAAYGAMLWSLRRVGVAL
jgi:hypothetical protein